MLNTIEEAAKNFCTHQIGQTCELTDNPINDNTYIASIDITTADSKTFRVFLAFDKASIQKVSSLFLEENESDDETLKDMILETTNLIVGSAKVIAQESDRSFDIGTPHFQKIDMFDFDFDEIRTFKMGENSFIIAIKEINV
jgi:CheY-specific phosphatase CheX